MGATTRPDWYLAIDLGTGGAKVAAVSAAGDILASEFGSITTAWSPGGGATQDPGAWWRVVVAAVRGIVESGAVDATSCVGVGLTGQWGSTVPVDGAGHAVGPCLLWADDRGAPHARRVVGGRVPVAGYDVRKIATWIRRAGGAPSTGGADPTGHALHLRHDAPETYRSARYLVEPVDHLGARLTGVVAATPASMVLSWLTDNRPGAAVVYDRTLVALAERDPERLPPLRPTGSVLGPVDPHVAVELGLPPGVPVVCGVPDLHTAHLGSGARHDYDGHVSISTTAWVSASVPFKKTDVARQMASIPGLAPGSYLIANNHETAGAALRWLRESVLGGAGDASPSYDELTAEAEAADPGAGGVIFAPWLRGERSPVDDRTLRGSFLNLSLATTRADLVRAVLEGVAYNAAWLFEATERFAGRPLSDLRIIGGGARSDLWCRIHADVIGRPLTQIADPVHVNVRGAAWFAALALGHVGRAELAAVPVPGRRFEPDPAAGHTYRPLLEEFRRLQAQQTKMYRRLNGGSRRASPSAGPDHAGPDHAGSSEPRS